MRRCPLEPKLKNDYLHFQTLFIWMFKSLGKMNDWGDVEKTLKTIFFLGPLIFAFGFLMPLIAQSVTAIGWTPPLGLSPIAFGFSVAALLGFLAQIRGRWI